MRGTLMFEAGWCGFGVGRYERGFVLCAGPVRITACTGRLGDVIAGYRDSLAAAANAGWSNVFRRNETPEDRARRSGL